VGTRFATKPICASQVVVSMFMAVPKVYTQSPHDALCGRQPFAIAFMGVEVGSHAHDALEAMLMGVVPFVSFKLPKN
jgi:hypothetical protein